ncbi:MAG: DUF4386 domain-containing protein [Bacteroidota bacterium]|nr:DUF4386 domain-containing protein [Bacteroidota bacterium]
MLTNFSLKATARLAGGCYLLTILTGMVGALVAAPRASALATLLSFGFYAGVTFFMYHLFAAAHARLSLLAAGISLIGCGLGVLEVLAPDLAPVKSLVFFGIYCLLMSYLIWHSGLLPRWLGGLLALSGLGWLTFLAPSLVHFISPLPMVSGLVGEGALTLWLLIGRVPYPALAQPDAVAIPLA